MGSVVRLKHVLSAMKFFFALLLLLGISICARAQGGIGNKPRNDLVLLGVTERDSLADEMFARITDLKRYALAGQADSAALMISWPGAPKDSLRWTRYVNVQNPDEKARVTSILDRLNKLFHDYPDTKREYFAIFKEKASPAGRRYHYQIHHVNGSKQKMVSWAFYGIGDKLALGDFN